MKDKKQKFKMSEEEKHLGQRIIDMESYINVAKSQIETAKSTIEVNTVVLTWAEKKLKFYEEAFENVKKPQNYPTREEE